jgi:hypothetical protein
MLKTIVELRATTADAAAMAAMASEQERQQTRSTLRQSEGQAGAYFKFGTDAVNTLSYYTTEIVAPFSQPELASRLAGDASWHLGTLAPWHLATCYFVTLSPCHLVTFGKPSDQL